MPTTKCGQCGKPAYITERDRDEGAEAYCSQACASGLKLMNCFCPDHPGVSSEFRDISDDEVEEYCPACEADAQAFEESKEQG